MTRTCRRGHTDLRVSVRSSGRTLRVCRVCERDAVERYRERQREKTGRRRRPLDPESPAPCGVCEGPRVAYWCPSEGRFRAKCRKCTNALARDATARRHLARRLAEIHLKYGRAS